MIRYTVGQISLRCAMNCSLFIHQNLERILSLPVGRQGFLSMRLRSEFDPPAGGTALLSFLSNCLLWFNNTSFDDKSSPGRARWGARD